jgi:hypothetical protein
MEDWRAFKITQIRIYPGRFVGSLDFRELQVLVPWMVKVQKDWEHYSDPIQLHFKALSQAMQEKGIRWEQEQSDLAKPVAREGQPPKPEPAASPEPRFRLKMPLEEETAQAWQQIPPAPVGVKPARPDSATAAVEAPSAEDDRRDEAPERNAVVMEEVEQPEELLAPRKEEPSESVSQQTVESQFPKVLQLQTREDVMWELQRLGPGLAQDRVLETLELANAVLGQATSLEQVRQISSIAEVLRACTRELALSKVIQDNATAFAIRSEYRANELLERARERGELSVGTRGQLKGRTAGGEPNISKPGSPSGMSQDPPPEKSTLAEAGIDKNFAKRIRRWGDLSREDLETRIEEKRSEGKLTKAAVLKREKTEGVMKPAKRKSQPRGQDDSAESEAPPEDSPDVARQPTNADQSEESEEEQRPHHLFLAFLLDLKAHPQHYDIKIVISDSALTAAYGQVRATFLELVDRLEPKA